MTLEVKDLGIGKLRAQLARLSKLDVFVGIQGEEARQPHPNADATIGQVAVWNHAGTEDIPARPFIDHGISLVKDKTREVAKKAIRALIDRRAATAEEALVPMGEMGAAAVREAIDTSREWAEPLAESTARRKGHDQPLLDTGTVRDSVTYEVRDGNEVLKRGTGLE